MFLLVGFLGRVVLSVAVKIRGEDKRVERKSDGQTDETEQQTVWKNIHDTQTFLYSFCLGDVRTNGQSAIETLLDQGSKRVTGR